MKKLKLTARIFSVILALVMLLSAVSCFKKTPEQVMALVEENILNAKSSHMDIAMNIGLDMGILAVDMKVDYAIDSTSDPEMQKVNMKMDAGVAGSLETTAYIEKNDGGYYGYLYADTGNGGEWMRGAISEEDIKSLSGDFNPNSTDLFLGYASMQYTEVGEEMINDVDTTHYIGVISGSDIIKLVNDSGVMDQILGEGVPLDGLEDSIIEDLDSVEINMWVSKDCYPVKYEIDMSELMNIIIQALAQSDPEYATVASMTVTTSISCEYSQINSLGEIVIPEEAKNAQEIDFSGALGE